MTPCMRHTASPVDEPARLGQLPALGAVAAPAALIRPTAVSDWAGSSAIAAMDLDTTGRQLTSSPKRPRVARGAATVASRPRDAEVDT